MSYDGFYRKVKCCKCGESFETIFDSEEDFEKRKNDSECGCCFIKNLKTKKKKKTEDHQPIR